MKWQRVLNVAVATVAMAVAGVGAGVANTYSFAETSITARDGSATVASATARMSHGYSSLSGKNFHTSVMTVRDRSSGDGRAVYGKVNGQRYDQLVQRRPGGSWKYYTWVGVAEQQTSRTTSSLSTAVSVSWTPRKHYGFRTITNVCVDIRLRPDNCAGATRTTLI